MVAGAHCLPVLVGMPRPFRPSAINCRVLPLDLAACGHHLARGFNLVYSLNFLATMKRNALAKLERFPGNLQRAAVELAKDWRTDKYLRNLEALIIVGDATSLLVITGRGDVLEPEFPIAAIGSGGNYALSAARALYEYEDDAEKIARKAMTIAAEVCVYTNSNFVLETLDV